QASKGSVRCGASHECRGQYPLYLAGRRRVRHALHAAGPLVDSIGLLPDDTDAGIPGFGAEPQNKKDPESDRRRNDRSGRINYGIPAEHRTRESPRSRATGDQSAEQHHRKNPATRIEESEVPSQPQFRPGNLCERAADIHLGIDVVSDLHARDYGWTVLLVLDL